MRLANLLVGILDLFRGLGRGFGCDACPSKFAADPERYGPYALKNEEAP